jgi:N-acetylglucosaminyldiphosphoundecaprenol N-acetyl-beta-D-mannosaminyltransferase
MTSGRNYPCTEILGVKIACLDQDGLVAQALEWSQSPNRHTIHYANAHSLNLACQDASYRQLLNAADLVYADGVSLAWSSRLLGGCQLQKLTGADWIEPLCAGAARTGVRLYLLGGRPGIAKRAAENLLNSQPSLTIVGTADGFFQVKTASQVVSEISAGGPHIVLVGLGVPRQEQWIAAQHSALPVGLWWGVGALFDFVAGVEPRVPRWLDHLGLEWFWRLAQDPAGKWRRYILGNPLFIVRVMAQYFRQKFSQGK